MTRRFVLRFGLWCVTIVALLLALRSFAPDAAAGTTLVTERLGALGLGAYLLYSLIPFAFCGAAWWVTTGEPSRRLGWFVWGRLVREAAADLLPFSQVGGIVIGAAAIVSRGIAKTIVYASFVADLTTELASQLLFTACGVAVLWSQTGAREWQGLPTSAVAAGLAATALLTALLTVAPAALPLAQRLARRVLPASAPLVADGAEALRRIYARPRRLVAAFALNLAAWFASAAGAWIVLRLMHVDAAVDRVIALESLIFLLRSTAFAIPAGIGIQEAGYGLIGPLLGLPMDAVFAVALAKRVRDLGIAVPVLVVWQAQVAIESLAMRVRAAQASPPSSGDEEPASQSV